MPSWLFLRIVLLCKTGGVMRFCEHFCAALVYKRGKFRGFCVKIVLDFSFGAVGFLVKKAQRWFGVDSQRTLRYERAAL
jgi:hypothetical protein